MRFTPIAVFATLFASALGAAIRSPAQPAGIALAREAVADVNAELGTDGRGGYNKKAELPGTDGRGGYNKRAEVTV